jgi:predicted transcriptional regulator
MVDGLSGADRRRAAGELEAQVMAALWAAIGPLTAGEVHEQLGGGLAYNTVQTILSRLADKQLVRRETQGRAHVYWPVRGQAATVAAQLRAALDTVGDREQVLQQFAATLDDTEAQLLRKVLADRPEDAP